MTSEDIRNVTFEQVKKGYRVEDVDDFLQQVARTMDELGAAHNAAVAERDQAVETASASESKMMILAEKVEEYRGQEDTLKNALINAQRMGETVVHEAKQKADAMLRDATGQTELLRQQAEVEILREQKLLEKLQSEVKRFRSAILNLYTQHIESLSALDVPIEQVDTFMSDNAIERTVEHVEEVPEAINYADAEPELPDDREEAVQVAGIETEAPLEDEAPVINLFEATHFEGVQIEQPAYADPQPMYGEPQPAYTDQQAPYVVQPPYAEQQAYAPPQPQYYATQQPPVIAQEPPILEEEE